ncbi:uncharacterized protein isoform X2 [Choristoneura fumiferana]|uniref:uncharacterized protein isoform X2 n=1 Tax=Choristoneura fumiferana TaxID=7141 RepID=UPI003D15E9C3
MNVQVQEVQVLNQNQVRPDQSILQNALVQLQTPQEQQQQQQQQMPTQMLTTISVEVAVDETKKTKADKKKKEAIDGQAREIIFKSLRWLAWLHEAGAGAGNIVCKRRAQLALLVLLFNRRLPAQCKRRLA